MRPVGRGARGQVRQEGIINRFAGAFLLSALLLASWGCSGHGKPKEKAADAASNKKAADEAKTQVINTQGGTAYGRTETTPRRRAWAITWKSAQLTFLPDGNSITDMKQTNGSFYQKGVEASQFRSLVAKADKEKGDIDVDQQVVVISLTQNATLRCDHIHYSSKDKEQIVKATGNVQVDGPWGTVSGLQEVWATPDLKTFGTPDLFQKQ